MGVNYAGVMALRKNYYKKHFTPDTATVDLHETKVQTFLSERYAGEAVVTRILRENYRPHVRLWEWDVVSMKHGVSAKSWLRDKLKRDFEYTNKQVDEYFAALTSLTVEWEALEHQLTVAGSD